VLQPPDALPRIGRLPGGVLQKKPEPIDFHAANSKPWGRAGLGRARPWLLL
jgi:hypothetical protein